MWREPYGRRMTLNSLLAISLAEEWQKAKYNEAPLAVAWQFNHRNKQ